MSHRERKEYIFYSSIALIPGVLCFGLLPIMIMLQEPDVIGPFQSSLLNALIFALTGGYLTLSIVSGFLLITRFYANKSKKFKVLSILLFMILPFFIYYFFFIISAPYYLYSLIKVNSRRFTIEM